MVETHVSIEGPATIMVMLGFTMLEISDADIEKIRAAAPQGSTIKVAKNSDEALAVAHDADAIFGTILTEKLFKAAPRLRWMHTMASGVDMMLYPAMRDSSVVLTGEKGQVGGHLADTGMGLLLALTRQIATSVRLGPDAWDQRMAMRAKEIELEGMTMGVVGFGGTGRAMARRATAFGMAVLATDDNPVAPSDGVHEVWGNDRLPELLERSDVVAICCPLTAKTEKMFSDEAFDQMKNGAMIVNVTRGEIIDGDALVRALQDGHCGGAALDVTPLEPLPADHALWTFDNVVMTPHTAGASQLRAGRSLDRFCTNLKHIVKAEPMVGVIDKQAGY